MGIRLFALLALGLVVGCSSEPESDPAAAPASTTGAAAAGTTGAPAKTAAPAQMAPIPPPPGGN